MSKKLKNTLKTIGKKGAVFVTVFMLLCSFLPGFVKAPEVAKAQAGPRGGPDCSLNVNTLDVKVSRTTFSSLDDYITIHASAALKTVGANLDIAKACLQYFKDNNKSPFDFDIYLYNGLINVTIPVKKLIATFYNVGDEYGFAAGQKFKISDLYKETPEIVSYDGTDPHGGTPAPYPTYKVTVYAFNNITKGDSSTYDNSNSIIYSTTPSAETTLPDLPGGIKDNDPGTSTTADATTISFSDLFFQVGIGNAKLNDHSNFYRISGDGNIAGPYPASTEKPDNIKIQTFSQFDATGIPITIRLNPDTPNVPKVPTETLNVGDNGTYIAYSKLGASWEWTSYFTSQSSVAKLLYLESVEDKKKKDTNVCAPSKVSEKQYFCDTKVAILTQDPIIGVLTKNADKTLPIKIVDINNLKRIGIDTSTSGALSSMDIMPTINTKTTWSQLGAGLLTSVVALPTAPLFLTEAVRQPFAPVGFTYAYDGSDHPLQKIYFQYYTNLDDLKAHVNDPVPSSVPGYSPSVTGNTEGGGAATVGQSLYEFITRVISDLIVLITGVIYWVFATLLVPILNALLHVRPYKDDFVNIIYPGWLILRNLANIFFIVSLLVVGLKILFQQSAAGTTRSFILRLVIMALLVNFSLVIAQGFVGIADTVQSQFLPSNTKIIEALGQKLMVEPIKTFRADTIGSGGAFSTSNADNSIAKTVKPIVLLFLTIAALFSFIALAAFLLVRLVVLWVLYMTSPVAYVGYVMEETKTYAKMWWKEFFKYVILTPVLVFFLNIAALMATLFAGDNTNQLFKAFGDGSIAQGIVNETLTIISQFIVLFFIYAGMKFALSSGTIGAKTIVDYSKKGFDALTTRPAKWAAGAARGAARSAAQTQWDRSFKGGMLDPFAYRDAYKKRVADTTKTRYAERMNANAQKFSPAGFIEDPGKSLKYLWYKGIGQGSDKLEKDAARVKDHAQMLTKDERFNLEKKYESETNRIDPLRQTLADLNANKPLSVRQGADLLDYISEEERRIQDEAEDYANQLNSEADDLRDEGNIDAEAAKRNQAKGVLAESVDKRKKLSDIYGKVMRVHDAAVTAGKDTFVLADDVKAGVSDELKNDIEDLEKEIAKLSRSIDEDNRRIDAFGGEMDVDKRRALEETANKINQQAGDRRAPISSVVKQLRREEELSQAKKIEETDDADELIAQYKKAMDKNNLPLASAIAKKMASEGSFADLLKAHGYANNMHSMQEFISNGFKKYAPQVRLQIMSEIGSLNEKNGNRAASRVTKIDSQTGQMRLATQSEHETKHNGALSKKTMNDAKKMKKNEFGQEGADGRLKLYGGTKKMLDQFKSLAKNAKGEDLKVSNPNEYDRKIRQFQTDMAPTAKAILEATNSNIIDPEAIGVLNDIAMKKP